MIRTLIGDREVQPTRSNTPGAASSDSTNKISLALAITFGIALALVALVFLATKTPILRKTRAILHIQDKDEHFSEFQNTEFDASTLED